MKPVKMILFDLDGTLLPMDMEKFTRYYFGLLGKKMAPLGYDPALLVKGLWVGVEAMMRNNDGVTTNEQAFWKAFNEIYGKDCTADIPIFNAFYANEFEQAIAATSPTPQAAEIISFLKKQNIRISLATNPIFPEAATRARIRWAGLSAEDFEKYTTYENDYFCKPNPRYFLHYIEDLQVAPEDCLMVGNDATEDLAALKTGMQVFLLTDCLINRDNVDLKEIPHGNFEDLRVFLQNLMTF